MHRYGLILLALVLTGSTGCCVVTQRQDTPVEARRLIEPVTSRVYWLYVPSNYSADKVWPLVVTLHGAGIWDSSSKQIKEWKYLAEKRGLIVAAPDLDSAAYCVLRRGAWMEDLAADEKAVLAVMDELASRYKIADRGVMLTGFMEGGYPLYYIGLRNSERLDMLVARDCYTDVEMMEQVPMSEAQWASARALEMMVFNGKDGWGSLAEEGWQAYRFLRGNRCFNAHRKEMRGGQLRRPERAYEYWVRYRGRKN